MFVKVIIQLANVPIKMDVLGKVMLPMNELSLRTEHR